jgi:hypothetical protein
MTFQQIRVICQMKQEDETITAITRSIGLSWPTIYKVLEAGSGASSSNQVTSAESQPPGAGLVEQ